MLIQEGIVWKQPVCPNCHKSGLNKTPAGKDQFYCPHCTETGPISACDKVIVPYEELVTLPPQAIID